MREREAERHIETNAHSVRAIYQFFSCVLLKQLRCSSVAGNNTPESLIYPSLSPSSSSSPNPIPFLTIYCHI